MGMKKKSANKTATSPTLRRRAEQMLRTSRTDVSGMTEADVQSLVHELQVHQMELEIQNEEMRQAQIELVESRDRYADLYEFAPVGYATLDREGKIVQANLSAANMLGLECRNLIGKMFSEFVHHHGQDRWHLHRQAVLSGSEKQCCELSLLTAQDGSLWARLESIAFAADHDDARNCRIALIDVADRKRAEFELEHLNANLEREVSEQTSALAILSDIAIMANEATDVEGAILYALKRVSDHSGWICGHAWLPGNDDPTTLHPSYAWYEQAPPYFDRLRERISSIRLRRGQDLVGRVFATGQPEFTADIGADLSVYKAPLAEYLGIQSACAFPIVLGDNVVGVLEFFSQKRTEPIPRVHELMSSVGILLARVVERNRSTQKLRQSEEQLRAILDAAPDSIVSIDRDGLITRVNQATERVFGYSADELLGQNVSILMPAPYREEHDGYLARYLETREPHIIGTVREFQAQHKEGRIFPIDLTVNEIDHMEMFIGIVRDISERKELEKQVVDAATDEQRRIGQDIHDGVGQELTGLRYVAQTHAESLAGQASPDAQTAERISAWLATVQRQLRAIIRQLVPVEVDSQGLAAALRGLAQRTSEAHDLTCEFQCPEPLTVADAALATQLYRIGQEAVANAVRHAQAYHVRIELTKDDDRLTLRISDDGVGITISPKKGAGIGLRSMAYRAGLIGAGLVVRNGEQVGTQVICTVLRG